MAEQKQLKSCPFCGGKIINHPSSKWKNLYAECIHDPYCFMLNSPNPEKATEYMCTTLIPLNERYIKSWNTRH